MKNSANVTATLVHQGKCWRIGAISPHTIKFQHGESYPPPSEGLLIMVVDGDVNASRVELSHQVLNYGWAYIEEPT